MGDSPPTTKGPDPRLTPAQRVAIEDIKEHINYFQPIRPALDTAVATLDVAAIRRAFDLNKVTSKRGKKLIKNFVDAFNFAPKGKKSAPAGKAEKAPKASKQKRHQLSIIIQRLMEAETR